MFVKNDYKVCENLQEFLKIVLTDHFSVRFNTNIKFKFKKHEFKILPIYISRLHNQFKIPYSLKVRIEDLWVITLEKNILLV